MEFYLNLNEIDKTLPKAARSRYLCNDLTSLSRTIEIVSRSAPHG